MEYRHLSVNATIIDISIQRMELTMIRWLSINSEIAFLYVA